MAHNGIISSMSTFTNADSSDTMEFIRRLASPLLHVNKNILQQKPILDTLHAVSGGRLAFIDKYGNLSIKGDFIKTNGVYYSNNSYCGRRSYYSIPTYNKYDAWDSYYGFGWEDSLDSWEDVYSCPKPNLKLNK